MGTISCLAVHQNSSLSEGKQEFSINHIVQTVEAQWTILFTSSQNKGQPCKEDFLKIAVSQAC